MRWSLISLLPWRRKAPTAEGKTAFQFMSDLHLEVGQQYATFEIPVPAGARYLILAGDIGRLVDYNDLKSFLDRQAAAFEKLFYVLGNHEFYGLSFHEGLQRARELQAAVGEKLVLLQQGHHVLRELDQQIHVLGCTLWSHIPPENSAEVAARVQDFSKIKDWSVDAHNLRHEEDLAWLKGELSVVGQALAKAGGNVQIDAVVVTHHAPCVKGTSSPQHVDNSWTCALATDLLDGGARDAAWLETVRYWVFGHTHFTSEIRRGHLNVVSNQRGYVLPGAKAPSKKEDPAHVFDARRVLQI